MLWLRLFGGCCLSCDGERLTGPAVQHRRLALFALAAASRTAGVSRDKLTAYFWPEEDRERARHFLADSLFTIRKALGKNVVLAVGSDVRLNPEAIGTDLWTFEDAFAAKDFASAVQSYQGPFLDGFFIDDAPEFERWVDTERERLGKNFGYCVEKLALKSEQDGDNNAAAEWWTRLSNHDPYNAQVAVRAMEALARSGAAGAAMKHALKYEKFMRDDLDLSPHPSVVAVADRLRSERVASINLKRSKGHETSVPTLAVEADSATPAETQHQSTQESVVNVPGNVRSWRRYALFAAALLVASASLAFILRGKTPGEVPVGKVPMASLAPLAKSDPNVHRSAREEAEELSHRGRLAFSMANGHGPAEGMSLFQKAIQLDSTYAPAYAGLADGYTSRSDWAHARENAVKALSLDTTLAEAHVALAGVLSYGEHRWLDADTALAKAIQLSPDYTLAHMRRAYVYAALGRADDALASAERARRNDPESWTVLYNRGLIEFAVNRPKESIPLYEAALALKPDELSVKVHLAWAYRATGRNDAASALVRAIGENPSATILAGDPADMRAMLDKFENNKLKLGPLSAAIMYAWLGNNEAAFKQLRKSVGTDKLMPLHMRQEPLVRLRNDPRYWQVMAQLGLH